MIYETQIWVVAEACIPNIWNQNQNHCVQLKLLSSRNQKQIRNCRSYSSKPDSSYVYTKCTKSFIKKDGQILRLKRKADWGWARFFCLCLSLPNLQFLCRQQRNCLPITNTCQQKWGAIMPVRPFSGGCQIIHVCHYFVNLEIRPTISLGQY